ncbi:efflux RND transporter periplasmic adaptor subunit [Myroides indicus]|uniref:Membrane fusion protein (Multidrug efflux system) n=1 Tax=Myroides indicus TaxID=1323422 RepID=A0A4R7F498_9FLAO|nr:efflux RND transporter periplasmic adaptor subunit [Myroides indicus]TDS64353.1 membrane fusion protein (multidrug efflux system) [Myroides indicus]
MNVLSKFLITICIVSLVSSCKNKEEQVGGDTTREEQFPLLTIQKEKVVIYSDYPATLKGIRDIDIRPKIDGYIESIEVDEGQFVSKGQTLFVIYAPQYQEEHIAAQAKIKEIQAEVNKAQLHVNKTKPLVQEGIISVYELEAAELTLKTKEAYLSQVYAAWNKSSVNVGYTKITAPFDGYIGLLPYKVGALVQTQAVEPLTTLSDIKTINAYFSMSEKEWFAFAQKAENQDMLKYFQTFSTIELYISDQQLYEEKGQINAVSGQMDVKTGSVNIRAEFPNPQHLLRSGSTGTIRVKEELKQAIVIPQLATFNIQGKHFVYVVNQDGVLESRIVTLLDQYPSSNSYIVVEGLQEGDIIIKEEIGGAREGMKILN